jgi:hypothetical protein
LKDYRHKVPWATTRTSFVDFNNAYEAMIPTGEQSGLLTRIAAIGSGSLCVRMKS